MGRISEWGSSLNDDPVVDDDMCMQVTQNWCVYLEVIIIPVCDTWLSIGDSRLSIGDSRLSIGDSRLSIGDSRLSIDDS